MRKGEKEAEKGERREAYFGEKTDRVKEKEDKKEWRKKNFGREGSESGRG